MLTFPCLGFFDSVEKSYRPHSVEMWSDGFLMTIKAKIRIETLQKLGTMVWSFTPYHRYITWFLNHTVLWDFFPLKLLFFSSYILESLYKSTSIQPLCEGSLAFNWHILIYWHMYKIVWNSEKHIFYCSFFAHLPFIYNEA